MSYQVNNITDMREVVRSVCEETRTSLTAMSDLAGLARGSMTRFASNRSKHNMAKTEVDIYFGTLLKFLDTAGYEVVVRRRDARSQRERARTGRGR